MAVTWGSVAGNYFKVGIELVATSTTDTAVTLEARVWVSTKWSCSDSSNTFKFDWGTTSASTSRGSLSINHTSNSGGEYNSNNTKRYAVYTNTYSRQSSAYTVSCAASLSGINASNSTSATATCTVSYTIPAKPTPPPTTVTYTDCGAPTSLSITANSNNTVNISARIGSSGTNNTAQSLDFYVTYNGATPNTGTFHYTTNISGSAGTTVSTTLNFNNWSQASVRDNLGSDYVGPIYVTARTRGSADSSYYSDCCGVAGATFYWRGNCVAPQIIRPSKSGKTCYGNFRVVWQNGSGGINNSLNYYNLRVYDNTSGSNVATYSTTNQYYICSSSIFTVGHTYTFYVKTVGSVSGYDSVESSSGVLTYKTISNFGTVTVTVEDGAAPKWGNNIMHIGTGTVATLSWPTPVATGNEVSSYYLDVYDANELNVISKNIGLVNKYHIDATDLPRPSTKGTMYFSLKAISKYTDSYNNFDGTISSRTLNMYPAGGMYWKIKKGESGYQQDVMKRAVAFIKEPANGEWKVCQGAFYKDQASGTWKVSDISYEVLMDQNGEIITDSFNEPIYTL